MRPDTPILTIALQIPVLPETNVEAILQAVAMQFEAALEQIRANGLPSPPSGPKLLQDPEAVPQAEFNATLIKEVTEEFSADTAPDLLSSLGYTDPDAK